MTRSLNTWLSITLSCIFIFGQLSAQITSNLAENAIAAAVSNAHNSQAGISVSPRQFLADGQRWEVRITQRLGIVHEGAAALSRDSMLAAANQKRGHSSTPSLLATEQGSDNPNLVVKASFEGNDFNGWTPPDNDIAVSNFGDLVSVTNTAIRIMDADGSLQLQADLGDFLDTLGLAGVYFDPRVVFDPLTNKYILVVLNGFGPPNSLVLGFSSSNDPMDDWFFYAVDGAPDNEDGWLDYPNIGISEQDFYVSGNVFSGQSDFLGVTVFQFAKTNGHLGLPLGFLTYSNVVEATGVPDFNLVPISAGYGNLQSPGIYLASTDFFDGNTVQVYYTTDSVGGNPELMVYEVAVPEYFAPVPGLMLGTNSSISTNDGRMQEGYLADSTIHFVMNAGDANFGFTRIYYGQIDLRTQTGSGSTYGLEGFEYAFPCIAPIGESETDGLSIIGYGRTGESIYPEYRMVAVDSSFQFYNDLLLRQGDNSVDVIGGFERWGDYTGADRWYTAADPTVYLVGNFGDSSQVLGTWISSISPGEPVAPLANFNADRVEIAPGESVSFLDLSQNSPEAWAWSFPGGSPDTANIAFPEITYENEGTYDVTLRVSNEVGADTITRVAYINVDASNAAPVVDFVADTTTITAGESVTFTDLSTNNPTSWTWNFVGGSPQFSFAQNPTVSYSEPGFYNVRLNAENEFGDNTETKDAYIEVLPEGFPPQANFSANLTSIQAGDTITFSDLTSNDPSELSWEFEGGTPATSVATNPQIRYNTPGVYDVKLTATNEFGSDEKTEVDFITVGVSSVTQSELVQQFSLGPNPVQSGAALKAFFFLPQRTQFDFYVVDASGRVIRQLLRHNVRAGNNELSFSTRYLPAGNYYLVMQQVGGQRSFQSTPFVVK